MIATESTRARRSRARAALTALFCVAAASCSGAQNQVTQQQAPPHPTTPSRIADDERRPPPPTHARPPRDVQVVQLRNDASRLVTFRIVFESGSADDPAGREGLTFVTARAMARGSTESMSFEEWTRRIFPMAATITANVSRDMTSFVAQVHRDHVQAFYPILRDVLLHPRFSEDDFRRVRTQTLSELTQDLRGNNDELLGKEVLQAAIYQGHPYGHPELGTATGLNRLTRDDVVAHRNRVFCRDRVLVGLAGGFEESLATQLRADMEQLPRECAERTELPAAPRPRGLHVVIVEKPSAIATGISIGFPHAMTRVHPDFNAVQFSTHYLGMHRQSSGVLYQTIREARGLNYGDYAYAEHFEQEGYSRFPQTNIQRRQQYASIWIRPVRPNAAHFALRAAVRALSRTIESGISQADFDRTRTFLTGYVSLFAQTESARLGYQIDDVWNGLTGAPVYPERMRTAWAGLDRAVVAETTRRHLTSQDLWIAIVAPNARELADALASNRPSPITYDSPKPPEVLAEDQEISTFPLSIRAEDIRVVPLAEVFQ